jgi:hypothetical protein
MRSSGSRGGRHLLGCQPSLHLGCNTQTSGFSERSTSSFAERHLAGFRNNLRRPVIPNATIRRMLGILLHDPSSLRRWRQRCTECIGLNHHLVNVVAFGALKRAEVETHACGHDASEHHVSTALWASGAMDVSVDVVGQEIGFLHDASLRGGGSATLSVTGNMPLGSAVIGQLWVLEFRFAVLY